MGVDPSSTCTAVTYMNEDGTLNHSTVWTRNPKHSMELWLAEYGIWINEKMIVGRKHDVVAVGIEELASSMNMDTTRKIAYVEGLANYSALMQDFTVYQIKATTGRKAALGYGGSKKKAYAACREKYGPDWFEGFGKFEMDVSDSIVMAEAARRLHLKLDE